jgi:hypothetical protein
MPRIPDYMLHVSIYLYPTVPDALTGEHIGGSGFLIGVPFQQKINGLQHSHVYAVTNSHVIRKGSPVIRMNRREGGLDAIPLEPSQWIHHPYGDDIAVCPIQITDSDRAAFTLKDALLTREALQEFDIGIGSDVVTIGRFISHEGKQQNLPVVRFGNIAMMPLEPILNDFTQLRQESFLIECHSTGGYSGSVVFASNRAFDNDDKQGGIIGINWGNIYSTELVRNRMAEPLIIDEEEVKWRVRSNSGMMGVVPAWKLIELLELEELFVKRYEIELQKMKEA